MTKGQRAMAVAMIYPETAQGKKSASSEKISEANVSGRYVNMARAVLKWAPEMADAVLPRRYWCADILVARVNPRAALLRATSVR